MHGGIYQKGGGGGGDGMCDIGSKYNIASNVLTCQICNNSERSEVPTRVPLTLAWFPEFRKSRSRPLEHHRPAFAVYQLLIRLLTCYRVSQSRAMLRLPQVYVPHLKNCAPPLKLALHCHSCDPNFITTHRLADNRPTL